MSTSTSGDRAAARALNSSTREGIAFLGSADDSALRTFVNDFFGGEDPGYESPSMLLLFIIDTTLPNDHNYGHVDEEDQDEATVPDFNGKQNTQKDIVHDYMYRFK